MVRDLGRAGRISSNGAVLGDFHSASFLFLAIRCALVNSSSNGQMVIISLLCLYVKKGSAMRCLEFVVFVVGKRL